MKGQNAVLYGGAYSTNNGMVFDGSDDYIQLDSWGFGDEPFSVEAYVQFNRFNKWSRIFDFFGDDANADSTTDGIDSVVLANNDETSGISFNIRDSQNNTLTLLSDGYYLIDKWIHVVCTIDSTYDMKTYVDGNLIAVKTSTYLPPFRKRPYHWIGSCLLYTSDAADD